MRDPVRTTAKKRSTGRRVGLALGVLLALSMVGCDDPVVYTGTPPVAPLAPGAAAAEPVVPDAGIVAASFRDEDFVEAETNRDPFRNYATMFRVVAPDVGNGGRDVAMSATGVEEMRVIGIVTGVSNARAMIVDREGIGHTVSRGQYIGRSEIVQAGGSEGLPVTLNWRVDRIRPGEIVLTRDDPTAPNRPPLTRVLPLRDEDEEAALGGVRAHE